MIAVDTNILVRLLVKDDEAQTRTVARLFQRLSATAQTAYVSDVVLCEVVWVLQACYKLKRKQIAGALSQLLAARQLTFDSSDRLSHALAAFEKGGGDLADYVIREHARSADCDCIVTFDKALHKENLFRSPEAV